MVTVLFPVLEQCIGCHVCCIVSHMYDVVLGCCVRDMYFSDIVSCILVIKHSEVYEACMHAILTGCDGYMWYTQMTCALCIMTKLKLSKASINTIMCHL